MQHKNTPSYVCICLIYVYLTNAQQIFCVANNTTWLFLGNLLHAIRDKLFLSNIPHSQSIGKINWRVNVFVEKMEPVYTYIIRALRLQACILYMIISQISINPLLLLDFLCLGSNNAILTSVEAVILALIMR